ncbi:MAG: glycosyltransferase family 2 protein [Acidimicrobiales bacterium]
MVRWSASVVIPAHQEEHALPRLLASLLDQESAGLHIEVVVAVNGSTDGTASVARAYVNRFAGRGHRLAVVELSTASKAGALNEGDQNVSSFPRLYLDADIRLSSNAVRRTVEVLSGVSTPMLAAPRVHVAENTALAARQYGRVWSRLPYIRSQVPGVGFYAVNESGRARWWRFPIRMGADDKFVRLHFDKHEAVVIDDASFTIFLPERFMELLGVRGRWTSFNREIAKHCPGLHRRDTSRWLSSARHVATTPSAWPDAPTFLAVWSAAWALSFLRKAGVRRGWARATSSPMRAPGDGHAAAVSIGPGIRTRPPVTPEPARGVRAVVVTYNSIATVRCCIERLLASEGIEQLRITVVDNASDDGTAQTLATSFPSIDVIANDVNVGFAAAVNQGTRQATSRWLAIVNPDAEVRPQTIAACVAHLEANPAVGCCGVPAVRADGTVNDRSFCMRPTIWSELTLCLGTHRLAPASRLLNPEQYVAHRSFRVPFDVDAIGGCFTVVDRALFERVGGYDEEYFLCGEDLDLGVRAIEAGASPAVVPAPPILHHSESSFAAPADARLAYLRGRAQYEGLWWPAHHAAAASAIRTVAILARLVTFGMLGSPRRDELAHLWERRHEWRTPVWSLNGLSSGTHRPSPPHPRMQAQ